MFINNISTIPKYIEQPTYVETINTTYNACNGTYQSDNEYFKFIYVNKAHSNREYINSLYEKNKYFGDKEIKAEEKIIEKNLVPFQHNFLDYYE